MTEPSILKPLPTMDGPVAVMAMAILAALPGRLAEPEECDHRFKAAINAKASVCLICRTRIEEETKWALYIHGSF